MFQQTTDANSMHQKNYMKKQQKLKIHLTIPMQTTWEGSKYY
jgi:hypothetical protein